MANELTQALMEETVGCRLSRSCWGTRVKLSADIMASLARTLDAQVEWLDGRKSLINTKGSEWRRIRSVLAAAQADWKLHTVDHPQDGVRLIRKDNVASFRTLMEERSEQLAEAVQELIDKWAAYVSEARDNLAEAFNPEEYDLDAGDFSIDVSFPSLLPDERLRTISPEIWAEQTQEYERVMEDALAMQRSEFAKQLDSMFASLAQQLAVGEDGKPKRLRASAYRRLDEFFGRFEQLNFVQGDLAETVQRARKLIGDNDVAIVNSLHGARERLAGTLSELQQAIQPHIVVGKVKRGFRKPVSIVNSSDSED